MRRGRCSWCGYRVNVRADGTAGAHPVHHGRKCLHVWIGTGQPVLKEASRA